MSMAKPTWRRRNTEVFHAYAPVPLPKFSFCGEPFEGSKLPCAGETPRFCKRCLRHLSFWEAITRAGRKLAIVIPLLLAGCLAVPGGPQEDGEAEGADAGSEEASFDGADGSQPPADWEGLYAVTWTLTGGDCGSVAIAADTIELSDDPPLARYDSAGCPAWSDALQSLTVGESITVDPLLQLHSCDGQTYDQLGIHTLDVGGGELLSTITTMRRSASTHAVLCDAEYQLTGTRE